MITFFISPKHPLFRWPGVTSPIQHVGFLLKHPQGQGSGLSGHTAMYQMLKEAAGKSLTLGPVCKGSTSNMWFEEVLPASPLPQLLLLVGLFLESFARKEQSNKSRASQFGCAQARTPFLQASVSLSEKWRQHPHLAGLLEGLSVIYLNS